MIITARSIVGNEICVKTEPDSVDFNDERPANHRKYRSLGDFCFCQGLCPSVMGGTSDKRWGKAQPTNCNDGGVFCLKWDGPQILLKMGWDSGAFLPTGLVLEQA